MDQYIPLEMLKEILADKSIPTEKRLKVAQEQFDFHKEMAERLEVVVEMLKKKE
jgi:hypothetical protein